MVLVIVARHIDLSVGSVMGFVGVLIAYLMYTSGWPWELASLAGLAVALLVSMYQGWLTAVPRRAVVRRHARRPDVVPRRRVPRRGRQDAARERRVLSASGRWLDGGIGVVATWALTALVIAGLFMRLAHERHSRRRHEMALEPLWLDVAVTALPRRRADRVRMDDEQLPDLGEGRAAGNSDPRPDLGHRRVRALVHRASDTLRALRVRDGRQSRCGRAGRHSGPPRDIAPVRAARVTRRGRGGRRRSRG